MPSYLVTGSSRNLGLAIVTHLAYAPTSECSIVFAAARSQTPALQALIQASSGKVVFIKMDTTSEDSVDSSVEYVKGRLGESGLDVLVNNADVGELTPGWTEKM